MVVTTTPSVEGKTIKEYLGIVFAKSDTKLSATRSSQGVRGAVDEIKNDAEKLGADAVVGVQFVGPAAQFYDTIHLYGTAVKFK